MNNKLNIALLEERLELHAEHFQLGGPDLLDRETYEWLCQELTIDYSQDPDEDCCIISLKLAGEKVSTTYNPLRAPRSGWLKHLIEQLAEDCRSLIMLAGAEGVRSVMRGAIGVS